VAPVRNVGQLRGQDKVDNDSQGVGGELDDAGMSNTELFNQRGTATEQFRSGLRAREGHGGVGLGDKNKKKLYDGKKAVRNGWLSR